MSADEVRMPAFVAWLFFVPGVVFIVVDIVAPPFEPTGLFLLGGAFLALWLWLIGGFTREFWLAEISENHPDALGSLDLMEREGQR
jgi:hypothetical protein